MTHVNKHGLGKCLTDTFLFQEYTYSSREICDNFIIVIKITELHVGGP